MPCTSFQRLKKLDTREVSRLMITLTNMKYLNTCRHTCGSDIHYVSNVYTNTSLSKHVREKRGLVGLAVPVLGKLATIAIEALGSHLQKKRRAMAKALERLESKQFLNKNQLYKLDNDF